MVLGKSSFLIIFLIAFVSLNTIYAKDQYYSTSDLNIRSEPTVKSEILFVIKKGTKVEIINKTNNWYKISYNGKQGFASAKFLKPSNSKQGNRNLLLWIITFIIIWYLIRKIWKTRCPKCGKFFVGKYLGRKFSHEETRTKWEKETYTHYNNNRQKTGTTEKAVKVYYDVDIYEYHYACKKCNHKWYYLND